MCPARRTQLEMEIHMDTRETGRQVMRELMGADYLEAKDKKRNALAGVAHGWLLSCSGCRCSSAKEAATEIGRLLHDELLGNQWLHSGVTANVHNPGVSMQGAAVGLYCAVVDRFDLLVSTRTMAARETRGGLQPVGREPAPMVGRTERWFSGGPAARSESGAACGCGLGK